MTRQTRRSIIRSISILPFLSISGCSAFSKQSVTPRLGELKALNFDDQPHTVHISIELDGEKIWKQSKQIEAAPQDSATGILFHKYPSKPAPYIINAWRDDQSKEKIQAFEFSDYETNCVGIDIQIGDPGYDSSDPHLSIFHTTNCPK